MKVLGSASQIAGPPADMPSFIVPEAHGVAKVAWLQHRAVGVQRESAGIVGLGFREMAETASGVAAQRVQLGRRCDGNNRIERFDRAGEVALAGGVAGAQDRGVGDGAEICVRTFRIAGREPTPAPLKNEIAEIFGKIESNGIRHSLSFQIVDDGAVLIAKGHASVSAGAI